MNEKGPTANDFARVDALARGICRDIGCKADDDLLQAARISWWGSHQVGNDNPLWRKRRMRLCVRLGIVQELRQRLGRRRLRPKSFLSVLPETLPAAPDGTVARRDEVWTIMQAGTPLDRCVFNGIQEGQTHRDIGITAGYSHGWVRSRLCRLRRHLRAG